MAKQKRIRLMDVAPPRLIGEQETAHLLGMSTSEFYRRAGELETKHGLPTRDKVFARRDLVAINRWIDRLFGVGKEPSTVSNLVRRRMESLNGAGAAEVSPGP